MRQIAIRSCPVYDIGRFPASLQALAGLTSGLVARYRRWRGLSGRRYIVSVYPIDECPDYVDAVVIAVEGTSGACVWIGETRDGGADFWHALAAAAEIGASEAHVHLLAGDAEARRAAVLDLDWRH